MNKLSSLRNALSRPFFLFLVVCALSFVESQAIIKKPSVIPGLFVFLGFLLMGIHNWRWSVYGLLAYLPFVGIPILALYPSKAPHLFKDFLFVIPAYIGFFASGQIFRTEERSFPDKLLIGFMLCFGFIVLAHLFNPNLQRLMVGFIGIKVWLFYMPLTVLAYHFIDSTEKLQGLMKFMVLIGLMPAIIVIVQFVMIQLGYRDLANYFYGERAQSVTMGHSAFFVGGAILQRIPGVFQFSTQNYEFLFSMVAISTALLFMEKDKITDELRYRNLFFVFIFALSCILCGTRRSFVFVPLFYLIFFFLQRNFEYRKRVFFLMGLLLVSVVYFFEPVMLYDHIVERSQIALETEAKQDFIESIKTTPMGLGVGMCTNPARHAFSHRSQFKWLSETYFAKAVYEVGIPGLIVLISIFGLIAVNGYKRFREMKPHPLKTLMALLLSFFVVFMIDSTKAQPLDWDPTNVYFWVFVGIMIRVPELYREIEGPEG